MKHIKLFEDFINESVISDAGYALNRLADNQVGGVPATEFQEEHNLDIDALTRAIVHTKEITRYELRDIIQGTAPKSKIKRFLKTYVMESVLNEEDTYNDYPAAAKKNAQMAIDWKEKYGRDEVDAGTAVGWARAHQLAKGENLSADTVGRMSAFNRHRKNSKISAEYKETPWKDRGYVAWLIWGGDEGVDWAMAKMDEISKTESNKKVLFVFDEFVNEKKKSKPKSDKQKIQDLTNKQKGLVKKARDIQGEIKDLAKSDDRKPTDKLQGLLLQSQMQQSTVDAQKAAVQKQQIELKSKIKTAKQKEKVTDKKV